jgi:hypothetical protein
MADPSRRSRPSWTTLHRFGTALARGQLSKAGLEQAAPLLVDHRFGDRLDALLPSDIEGVESVPLLYAAGRRAVVAGRPVEARAWLTKAQSRTTRRVPDELRSRLAFELGCVLLDDGGTQAAESVADWSESFTRASSDVLHLRALIAERRGDRASAIALYRRAIASATSALSPLSRVLELRNLAETLAHETPAEAVTMYRHAIETLTAHGLDPRLAPALHNGLAYAAICEGDLALADKELDVASRDALRLRLPLMRGYSLYNRSIVFELRDQVTAAVSAVAQARSISEAAGLRDLAAWCWIREAWLELKRKDRQAADRAAASARALSSAQHSEALSTLDAFFALLDGEDRAAGRRFEDLARTYLGRSDILTAFALLLWRAVTYRRAKATKGAKAAARRACELRRKGAVRLSPSWWSYELLESAREDGGARCAEDLHPVAIGIVHTPRVPVEIRGDEVLVEGKPIPADEWQLRSGARVLRRVFAMLVAAHPRGIARDRLADQLWPDSEGDKAVRNLYAAMKDLRKVLSPAAGISIVARGGGYALVTEPNVRIAAR